MLRKLPRVATWAAVAFALVLVLALVGCKPMVFDGPRQSRKEQIALGACAFAFIVLGLTQVPPALREYRRERELEREKHRRILEQLGHAR